MDHDHLVVVRLERGQVARRIFSHSDLAMHLGFGALRRPCAVGSSPFR
jgi:hypothetical protein